MSRPFKPGDRVTFRGKEGVIIGPPIGDGRLRVQFSHVEWLPEAELIRGRVREKDVDRKDWKSAAANDAD